MTSNTSTEELQKRDRAARSEKIYDSPGMKKLREVPKRTPAGDLNVRHANERAVRGARQHLAGKEQLQRHEQELAPFRRSSRPIPKEILDRHTRERADLTKIHDAERRAEDHRHLVERDQLRGGK